MSDARCAFLLSSTNGRLAFARVFVIVGLEGSEEVSSRTGEGAVKPVNGRGGAGALGDCVNANGFFEPKAVC